MNKLAVEAVDVKKTYTEGNSRYRCLKGVTLTVKAGEIVAIVGTSGSGEIYLAAVSRRLGRVRQRKSHNRREDLGHLAEKERTILRNRKLGFVYQFHHLLPEFTALESIAMPLRIRRDKTDYAENKALELLGVMGLWDRKDHLPSQLSGGRGRRVAIARATVGDPVCLFSR